MSYNYDVTIYGIEAWDQLADRGLGIVVDPLVFRLGQFFLEGRDLSSGADEKNANQWGAIESDVGAVISFLDLVVLHDQLPAFNYNDTYDHQLNFGDPLGAVMNASGEKILVHVDVEHHMYRAAKSAAIDQLESRLAEGLFLPKATAVDILETLNAIKYQWEPSLGARGPKRPSAAVLTGLEVARKFLRKPPRWPYFTRSPDAADLWMAAMTSWRRTASAKSGTV